jgi:hypothetical protein
LLTCEKKNDEKKTGEKKIGVCLTGAKREAPVIEWLSKA